MWNVVVMEDNSGMVEPELGGGNLLEVGIVGSSWQLVGSSLEVEVGMERRQVVERSLPLELAGC